MPFLALLRKPQMLRGAARHDLRSVRYKHTGDDVTTVTASCDRITIHSPLTEICDLQLSGRVTYATGRSSLEITMQVAKAPKEGEQVRDKDVLINCTFTMVSLDPGTKR